MSDDKKSLKQIEDIDNIREIARLEKLAEETEKKLLELKKQIKKIKTKDKHRFRLFIRRLDVAGGLHWVKLLFWIGMADAIIFLSSDADTKAISSITYLMGIIFDMLLLRKQQSKTCADVSRFVEGILISVYIVFSMTLGIGIASTALGYTLIDSLSLLMDWGLPICGILSTLMELIDNVIEND